MRSRKFVIGGVGLVATLLACDGIIGTRDISFDPNASDDAASKTDGNVSANDGSSTDGTTSSEGSIATDGGSCPGVDLTSDGKNCGACNHDCLGGVCTASKCQPVAFVTGVGQTYAIAVDSTNVYFSEVLGGYIYSIPKNATPGTPATKLATTSDPLIYDLVLDTTTPTAPKLLFSYGSESDSDGKGALEMINTDGGARKGIVLDASVPRGLSFDNEYVYYATPDDTTPAINQIAKTATSGTPTKIAPNEPNAEQTYIAGTSTEIFWIGESQEKIRQCNTANCAATIGTFIDNIDNGTQAITSNSTHLFYTDGVSVFYSAKTGTGVTPTAFAANQPQPVWIAADDAAVYWVNTGTNPNNFTDGDIRMCPINGAGVPACTVTDGTVVGLSEQNPRVIVMDATAVYWTVQYAGAVYRLAR